MAGGPCEVASGLLFRVAASLAVALQRGNFGVLAAAAPALASRAGCLARPLGEEPEAWRAAPAAAISLADDFLDAADASDVVDVFEVKLLVSLRTRLFSNSFW